MTNAQELQEQGVKLFQQKDYEAAARLFQQAQDAYETEGKRDMVGEMQTNLGLVHRVLGEHQQALDMMQSALAIFQELSDPIRVAKVLGNLGGVYAALGDKEQAYNSYRQAADIFDEQGEKKLYGETLIAMGDLQVRDGKIMAGAATYEVGLENLDQLNAGQKVIKGLLGIRNKLTGGGKT
ncbi:MAG: tetratricopeptide repeat protein [Anaerolineae bacterium]|nr:tetratricopeptide repeat protein [Anaerolineae bacterium]